MNSETFENSLEYDELLSPLNAHLTSVLITQGKAK